MLIADPIWTSITHGPRTRLCWHPPLVQNNQLKRRIIWFSFRGFSTWWLSPAALRPGGPIIMEACGERLFTSRQSSSKRDRKTKESHTVLFKVMPLNDYGLPPGPTTQRSHSTTGHQAFGTQAIGEHLGSCKCLFWTPVSNSLYVIPCFLVLAILWGEGGTGKNHQEFLNFCSFYIFPWLIYFSSCLRFLKKLLDTTHHKSTSSVFSLHTAVPAASQSDSRTSFCFEIFIFFILQYVHPPMKKPIQ